MLLIQIAISLAICLLLGAGSAVTAKTEMAALSSARTLQFYTQDIPTTNLALQKLVSKAASFNIYSDLADATSGLPGGTAGLTNSAGTVVRLNFAAPPATPGTYPVGFLCSVPNDGLYYFATTSTTANGAGVIASGSTSALPSTAWKVAGWANAAGQAVPANSGAFNCLFSVSDPFDTSGTASGLLVISLMENSRAVTLYAERF